MTEQRQESSDRCVCGGGRGGEFQSQGAVQLNALVPLVLRREMGTDRRPAQCREGLGEVGARGGGSLWSVLCRIGRWWSSVRMRVVAPNRLVHVRILSAGL